ncbi:MAG TPA: hypothetical protein VNN15_02420 [Solirubrobacterales bacterium]|nr:hypothetical protein [Solirubrobacterales bacterium]
MNRTLKVLGLALTSVLVFSAVVAASASATTTFTAESPATLTVSANETQVFSYTAGGAQVKCTGVSADETAISGTSATEITVHPTFTGCIGPGGITGHTTYNGGCDLLFTVSGQVHICPNGGSITMVVTGLCTYHLGPQTVSTVTYDNIGSGTTREIKLTPSVTGISATNTNPGFLCGPESSTTGTYSGSLTITGENGAGQHIGLSTD